MVPSATIARTSCQVCRRLGGQAPSSAHRGTPGPVERSSSQRYRAAAASHRTASAPVAGRRRNQIERVQQLASPRRAPARERPSSRASSTRFSTAVSSLSIEANWPVRLRCGRARRRRRGRRHARTRERCPRRGAGVSRGSGSSSSCRRRSGQAIRRRGPQARSDRAQRVLSCLPNSLVRPVASIAGVDGAVIVCLRVCRSCVSSPAGLR